MMHRFHCNFHPLNTKRYKRLQTARPLEVVGIKFLWIIIKGDDDYKDDDGDYNDDDDANGGGDVMMTMMTVMMMK